MPIVAVLLLMAILPTAVAVTSPASAAILETALHEPRCVYVQRERDDPAPAREARFFHALYASRALNAAARPTTDVRRAALRPLLAFHPARDARTAEPPTQRRAMTRAGVAALPPPIA